MSLFILVAAAGHAIPPILGATVGKTKQAVIIGAVIGGTIGVISGGAAYLVLDLAGVGFGTWIGLKMVESKEPAKE